MMLPSRRQTKYQALMTPDEAPIIARELLPKFSTEHLVGLPNYHIYLKLMIDGAPCS